MKKILFSGSALLFCAFLSHAQTYDLSRDFSGTSNPTGAWSYGWQTTLGGAFTLMTIHSTHSSDNGVPLQRWGKYSGSAPEIWHNASSSTATSGGGQGNYPPGTTLYYPGVEGYPENFSVIRFTVPAGGAGTYSLATTVRPAWDGSIQGDTDFHVLRNGTEIFGRALAAGASANYSNSVPLAAGDTIDCAIGRGADGSFHGSGLKIDAVLNLVSSPPPPPPPADDYDLSRDFALVNPNGAWSYGWETTLGGAFTLMNRSNINTTDNGVPIQRWAKYSGSAPEILHNDTTSTATTDGGQGNFPPETTWFYPGVEGNIENFCMIRFTVPAGGGGTYRVATSVRPAYNGSIQRDTDFHVLRNGVELFGRQLAAGESASYSNTVALAAGNTIDFAIGRGADNSFHGSGLKIDALINLVGTNQQPPINGPSLVVPRVNENVDGSANGGGGSSLLRDVIRLQDVYGSSLFPTGRLTIREIRLRPSAVWGNAFTSTVANLQINLSTTLAQPNGLSSTFASNVGPNDTVVFHGPITLSSRFVGPADGPKEFDIVIPLTTPFEYIPAHGNLLVDWRNHSGSSAAQVDAGGALDDNASRAFGFNMSSGTASSVDKGAEVLQLVYTLEAAPPPATHDLSRDFAMMNPNGVWSYGWETTLGGSFTGLGTAKTNILENGVPIQVWAISTSSTPAVMHNATTNTGTSDGGQAILPPGVTWFYPGVQGNPQNFGVIRFTVPAGGGGTYSVDTAVRPTYNGSIQGDTDFHVLRNGAELFGQNLAAGASANYSDNVSLAAGDTIDFAIGRGLDNNFNGSSLKIDALINLVGTNQPPPPAADYDLSRDFALVNPNGSWSYGWETTLGGSFTLMSQSNINTTDNGVPIQRWAKYSGSAPEILHNDTTSTGITDGGQGNYPPETTWYYPGVEGNIENFSVIRFTVPVGGGGTYSVATSVRPAYNGSIQGDTDFHVLRNGTEVFGRALAAGASASYSNTVALAAGDTVDFAIGRGADNSFHGSGLKIDALIDLVATNQPPPVAPTILVQPADQQVTVGGSVTFTVTANGTAPLAYQWRRNGADIAGANSASLTVNNVQFADAGQYSVRVSNAAGAVTSSAATLTVEAAPPIPAFDPAADFSLSGNPNGPWSYGYYESTLGTGFNLLTVPRHLTAQNGVEILSWALGPTTAPAVYYNATTQTATTDGGRGVFPPGTLFFEVGWPETPADFGVIRFTVPSNAGGQYHLESFVRPHLNGPTSETHYYVVKNGVILFDRLVQSESSAEFDTPLTLSPGDTLDFVIGRGPSDRPGALILEASLFACAAPPEGLVGWWPLDGSGEDIVGNNSATLIGNPRFGPGKVEQAMLADGVDDEARMPASSTLDVGTAGGLSIEAWINPTEVGVQHPIVEWNNHQIAGAHFWISVGPSIGTGPGSLYANLIDINQNSHVIATVPALITTGRWQHVAVTYDKASGNAALYLNGVVAAQRNLGTFTAETTYDLFFGRRIALPGYEAWFAGGLDEISLYNRALSASEISGIYNAGSAGKCKPANTPPVAKAIVSPVVDLSPKLSDLLVISANGSNATVTLDGSQSVDPDGDSLTYMWFANGSTTPVASGANAMVNLALGSHEITLVVSDGRTTASDSVELEVVTIEQVLDILVVLVEDTDLARKSKRPLIMTLKQASGAVEGDRAHVAINKLEHFQEKVAAQVAPINQECAEALINAAQQVIDALSAPAP